MTNETWRTRTCASVVLSDWNSVTIGFCLFHLFVFPLAWFLLRSWFFLLFLQCIIMGIPIPLGTGLFKLLMNENRIRLPPTPDLLIG